MKRYKSIKEDFKSNFLDQAEIHLKDGNFHSAVRSIGRALGMRDIPSKFDKQISTQEKNFLADNNNINNFTVLQNIKKILSGKGSQIIKMQHTEPMLKRKTANKMIAKAVDNVRNEYMSHPDNLNPGVDSEPEINQNEENLPEEEIENEDN